MRISLRTKVTLALVAFGLIPAGIIAAFAYWSAEDFMVRQQVMIQQAAAAISDHAKLLVLKNQALAEKGEKPAAEAAQQLVPWKFTDADYDSLRRQISVMLR